MKNRLLSIVAGIILLLTIGYFALPNQLNVNSSIIVNAPIEIVFEQVNDLKNWESWSPWKQLDPHMKINYGTSTKGKGGSYSWRSRNPQVDRGSIEIENSTVNETVETKIFFRDDKSKPGSSKFLFKKLDNQKTEVTWAMTGEIGANPLNKFIGMIVNGKLGQLFEAGLIKLKSVSEKQK